MKLLLNANLSPRVAAILSSAGHAATHVAGIGMLAASDEEILTGRQRTRQSSSPDRGRKGRARACAACPRCGEVGGMAGL
ncbi:MAG: DUF5615 family PIN-like protein [Sporichthyaceae bacterium]